MKIRTPGGILILLVISVLTFHWLSTRKFTTYVMNVQQLKIRIHVPIHYARRSEYSRGKSISELLIFELVNLNKI